MDKLFLKTPDFDELWYRKKLLADPKTMNYNSGYDCSGYDFGVKCYNSELGTIDFDEIYWEDFYKEWVEGDNTKFYAYIVRKDDNAFIGEVAYKYDIIDKNYSLNILLEGNERGFGYSKEVLKLLIEKAFENKSIDMVTYKVMDEIKNAVLLHKQFGFKKIKDLDSMKKFNEDKNIILLGLTKEDYFIKTSKNKFTAKVRLFLDKLSAKVIDDKRKEYETNNEESDVI